jgi:hypothetical protein
VPLQQIDANVAFELNVDVKQALAFLVHAEVADLTVYDGVRKHSVVNADFASCLFLIKACLARVMGILYCTSLEAELKVGQYRP